MLRNSAFKVFICLCVRSSPRIRIMFLNTNGRSVVVMHRAPNLDILYLRFSRDNVIRGDVESAKACHGMLWRGERW